ncbi:MAG: hypothetical protein ACQCN5_10145 [Candidatus Bathyarchaeia archaeon]|jgi:hypothetical protein
MGKTGKVTTLLLLAGVALLFVPSALASENTIGFPEPFVPKFTVQYVDRSYDVPTTTSSIMNPYTGEVTNTTIQGYHVEYKTVDIKIENQPIPASNTTYTLFYNIREKGHFGADWHEIYDYSSFTYQTTNPNEIKQGPTKGSCPASKSKYTIISLKYNEGDQVDFQVKALYGYSSPSVIQHALFASLDYSYVYGEWSATQTITVSGVTQTPLPNPTNTPTPTHTTPENANVTSEPIEIPTQSEKITQTSASFFLENKNILAFGVSCITIGVLMVALACRRKIKN